MNKFVLTLILVLSAYSSGYASSDSNTAWGTYKKNNSIIGFKLGESTIEDIAGKMGGKLPSKPEDKHELASVCFNVFDKPDYIIFSTGVRHDYSTLYGFQISKNIPDIIKSTCTQYKLAKNEDLVTNGGLHIGQSKNDVLRILTNPIKKSSQNWTWDYKNYQKYDTPKVSSSKAGPTDAKYIMKIISKGAYEDSSISIEFLNDIVVGYSVHYFAESDFKIEHYDVNTGKRIR